MRFLADAGISPRTVEFLRALGHDVVHVREIAMQRAPDATLIELARTEQRIVLTFDLDFGEILALGVQDRPSVILFRLANETADSVNQRVSPVIAECASVLQAGALVLVEDSRYRIRRLPFGRSRN